MKQITLLSTLLFCIAVAAVAQKQNMESFNIKGVSFNMIRVDGGTFTMGATPEQGDEVQDNEKPAHEVTLSTFYIGETEVTQALWKAVMGDNPSRFRIDDHPVHNVIWNECQTFVSKLNALTGKQFRLPTEAEWEYAARGGNKSKGYKYSGSNKLKTVGWCKIEDKQYGTKPVKQKKPNELGLYDMSGNVWEWCQDWYLSLYINRTQTNPTGPPRGYKRVTRGGCWGCPEKCCRISYRAEWEPNRRIDDVVGMRLCMTADEGAQQLTVEQMSAAGNDISASQYRVMDSKGQPCALVKVLLPAEGATFEGSVIGTPQFKQGEYWVYMPAGAKELTIRMTSLPPCSVNFNKHGIQQLNSLCAYTLTLTLPKTAAHAASGNTGQLNIDYTPMGAEVLLDGRKLGTAPNVFGDITDGKHTLEINMKGYNTVKMPIIIKMAEETKLSGQLMASASASAPKNGTAVETVKVNDVKFNMIRVDGGTFTMSQKDAYDKETTQHVTLSTYYIGETEVTQELWKAVMDDNPSYNKGDQLPVENISWEVCQTFIEKLNKLTNKHFRLPTEAEWEYAARGGNKSKGYPYSGSDSPITVGWLSQNSGDRAIIGNDIVEVNKNNCISHPVKLKKPNELGLYDMSGNVSEWCYDWEKSYTDDEYTNPAGPSTGTFRILRGGCYRSSINGCKVTTRDHCPPDISNYMYGFRLVY